MVRMEASIDAVLRYHFDDETDAGISSHYGFFGGFRLCPEMLRKKCSTMANRSIRKSKEAGQITKLQSVFEQWRIGRPSHLRQWQSYKRSWE